MRTSAMSAMRVSLTGVSAATGVADTMAMPWGGRCGVRAENRATAHIGPSATLGTQRTDAGVSGGKRAMASAEAALSSTNVKHDCAVV